MDLDRANDSASICGAKTGFSVTTAIRPKPSGWIRHEGVRPLSKLNGIQDRPYWSRNTDGLFFGLHGRDSINAPCFAGNASIRRADLNFVSIIEMHMVSLPTMNSRNGREADFVSVYRRLPIWPEA